MLGMSIYVGFPYLKRGDQLHVCNRVLSITPSSEMDKFKFRSTEAEWQHDRSQSQAPPMPVRRYEEGNSSTAKLAVKRSAGITPQMNLRERTPPPSTNKATKCHSEIQNRGISSPTKELMFSNIFIK